MNIETKNLSNKLKLNLIILKISIRLFAQTNKVYEVQ